MKYSKVQSYRVEKDWDYQTGIATSRIIHTEYIDLECGWLRIKKGFCFEPSGPAMYWPFNRPSGMRGYCAHDAIYWLIRNGHLEKHWKGSADRLMRKIHKEDGYPIMLAKIAYQAVDNMADWAIDPKNRVKVQTAP